MGKLIGMGRRAPVVFVLLLALVLSAASAAAAQPAPARYLLVKLHADALAGNGGALSAHGIGEWTPVGVPGWVRVPASPGIEQALAGAPAVLAVEPERRLRAMLEPDDTYWPAQWAPVRIDAPAAWNITTGRADVVVAVLDSGVQVSHPDLAGQLWINPAEVAGNGLDDDSNGRADDVHGWRFNHDASGTPCESADVTDDYGHGTHVAGILAAGGNNQQGIAGLAWGSRLMIVRVLDAYGDGWYSDVAAGIVYAVDNGARIVNLSLGGNEDDPLLRDAVAYAAAHDVLLVAAAGNRTGDSSAVLYPAAYETVTAVAATNWLDNNWGSSCYGPEVDLAAPGDNVYSTCLDGLYCSKSGTSMAAPHVSGLAALLWSLHPELTTAEVNAFMADTALDLNTIGWDEHVGWGRIDAHQALMATLPYRTFFPLFYVTPDVGP